MHWWFSGRILSCHAGSPGSIPGQCKTFLLLFCLHFLDIESLIISLVLETEIELVSAQVLLFNVQSEIARFHMTLVRYWLVPQNSETATSPVRVEPFSYVKTLFFS